MFPQQIKPLHVTLEIFGVLFFLFVLIWLIWGDAFRSRLDIVFVLGIVCLALVVKQVYDSMKLDEAVTKLAETIANEIVVNSQDLFGELYRNSPVAYVLLDRTGIIHSANFAALRLFGETPERFEGSDIFNHFAFTNDEEASMVTYKLERGVVLEDAEFLIKRRDGVLRWVQLSLFFYKTDRREERSMMTLIDIEKQKQVDTAKSEFVSLASHQLRTPIAGMRWSAELLELDHPERLSENQRRYVARLLKSIDQMELLVNDFLNISQLELGTLDPTLELHDLQQLCDDAFSEFTPQIVTKNITIIRDYDTMVKGFMTDKGLLRNVLTNLISNGIKYGKQNGRLTLTYRYTQEHKLTIVIADTGIGIPIEEQGLVFEKIYRATNVRQSSLGTGLGLYIVRKSIEVLNGNIQLDSVVGIGTTFTITLPFEGTLIE